MKRPWWIAAPLAWAAVVMIVALVAWWVIDAAGQGIVAESSPTATTDAISGSHPQGNKHRSSGPKTKPPTTPTKAPSNQPPTQSSNQPSGQPSDQPSETTRSTDGPASSTPPPPPSSESTDPGGPDQTTRTWQGEAGILRVSCTGSSLRLEGASPHDGYVVDKTEHEGGRELEVKFRSTDGEREVEIHVVCSNGVPEFTVDQSGENDD